MKKTLIFLILSISIISFSSCGARSDETTPEMAQNMLKLRGFNFTEPEFFRAIKLNDGAAVKGFLQGGINANAQNEQGETALNFAIQNADSPLIKLIIEKADVNQRGKSGNSPLHLALIKNKDDIFKLLLEKNADVNISGKTNSGVEQSVLYVAVSRSDEDLVKQLLDKGADPNKADGSGSLPLVEAVVDADANPKIVQMMIEKGADVNKTEKENNAHALIFIAQNELVSSEKRKEIAKMLLDKGADKSIKDTDKKTALVWAKEKNNAEVIELLK